MPTSGDHCSMMLADAKTPMRISPILRGLVVAQSSAGDNLGRVSSLRRGDSLALLSDRVRRGDLAAFEELFRAMHAPLCEIADSYVQSQAIAEEIVQDLFFAIWMKRDQLQNVESLQAYLFTAARNRSL